MGETAKGTGAPVRVEVGGVSYSVKAPTFADFGEFEVWAEREAMLVVLSALSEMDPASRAAVQAGALADAPRGPAASDAIFGTLRGHAFFAWLVIRDGAPDMTPERIVGTFPREDLDALVTTALDLSAPEDKTKGGAKTSRPF